MDKMYYSIREVSQLVDEESHVLRYWEKEFNQLHPKKNSAGNRSYTHKDIQFIVAVKTLLRDKKLTLKLAKAGINDIDFHDFDINKFNPDIKIENTLSEKPVELKQNSSQNFNLQANQKEELLKLLKRTLEHLKN